MTDHFSATQRIALVLIVVAIATVGLAAIGSAQTADYSTNDSVELTNDTEPITVAVDWNDSASTETATVTFENETAANNTGDVTGDLQAETLNGTDMTLTTVYPAGTYTVDLNESGAGTVSVNSSAFDSNGTVDLTTQATNVTTGDAILSVSFAADSVLTDSLTADAGNTTEAEFNQSDSGLVLGDEYRVTVTGPDSAIDSASIDDSSGLLGGALPGTGGLEGGGGVLAGVAVIGAAMIGVAAYTMRD